jgi:osmoprotectant transport system permease protein
MNFFEFFYTRGDQVLEALLRHMQITLIAVGLAVLIGVPVGIIITKHKKIAGGVLGVANIFQTLPSLALFGLIIPILGIGITPSIFVLFLYALLPIKIHI